MDNLCEAKSDTTYIVFLDFCKKYLPALQALMCKPTHPPKKEREKTQWPPSLKLKQTNKQTIACVGGSSFSTIQYL